MFNAFSMIQVGYITRGSHQSLRDLHSDLHSLGGGGGGGGGPWVCKSRRDLPLAFFNPETFLSVLHLHVIQPCMANEI